MLNWKNLQLLAVETILPHIIVIARKDGFSRSDVVAQRKSATDFTDKK
jgi:hypothetical protein